MKNTKRAQLEHLVKSLRFAQQTWDIVPPCGEKRGAAMNAIDDDELTIYLAYLQIICPCFHGPDDFRLMRVRTIDLR